MRKKPSCLSLILVLIVFYFSLNIPSGRAQPSITYNAGSNIITVLGYTSTVPCTSVDIYNADVSGGWGVVTRTVGAIEQYSFNCRLVFGNGSYETHFADSNKQWIFTNTSVSANGQYLIDVKANAYFTLGLLIDEGTKSTSNGVSVFLADTPYQFLRLLSGDLNSHIFIYNSQFVNTDDVRIYVYIKGNSSAYSRFWNSQFDNLDSIWLEYLDLFNVLWTSSDSVLTSFCFAVRGPVTADTLTAYNSSRVFSHTGIKPFSIKNVYARNNTEIMLAYRGIQSLDYNPHLINVDSDTWDFFWVNSGSLNYNTSVFREYEFDLTVTYPNGSRINGTETGARVQIEHYGNNSGVDLDTTLNADGTINTQILTMGHYNFTGLDSIYPYGPFSLTVSNVTGFNTYTKNFTLTEKMCWEIALSSESETIPFMAPFFFLGLLISIVIGALIFTKK